MHNVIPVKMRITNLHALHKFLESIQHKGYKLETIKDKEGHSQDVKKENHPDQ